MCFCFRLLVYRRAVTSSGSASRSLRSSHPAGPSRSASAGSDVPWISFSLTFRNHKLGGEGRGRQEVARLGCHGNQVDVIEKQVAITGNIKARLVCYCTNDCWDCMLMTSVSVFPLCSLLISYFINNYFIFSVLFSSSDIKHLLLACMKHESTKRGQQ